MTGIDWGGEPNWDLWRWVMSCPNPYTGEDAWQRMQREAAGEPPPRLTTPAERATPDRNPDPYTASMFRAEHPGLTPGQTCPSCEDEDSSIADTGVCYLCVCGCSYCEPEGR